MILSFTENSLFNFSSFAKRTCSFTLSRTLTHTHTHARALKSIAVDLLTRLVGGSPCDVGRKRNCRATERRARKERKKQPPRHVRLRNNRHCASLSNCQRILLFAKTDSATLSDKVSSDKGAVFTRVRGRLSRVAENKIGRKAEKGGEDLVVVLVTMRETSKEITDAFIIATFCA